MRSFGLVARATTVSQPPLLDRSPGADLINVGRPATSTLFAASRILVVALLAFAFISRLIIAITVPPWQAPDEPKHFEYVRTMIDKRDQLWAERRLLTLNDAMPGLQRQIIDSMTRNHFWAFLGVPTPRPLPVNFAQAFAASPTQLHRPSLYYDLGAVVMLPLQDASIEDQLLAMRVLSAVISALAVLPAFAIGRLVAPQDAFVRLACAALVAMLPMGMFIGGMMSVDDLLLPIGMLAVLGMARGVIRGFTWRDWLLIISSTVLGLLTKRGAVVLLPGVFVCGLIALFRARWAVRGWILAAAAALIALAALGFVTGSVARMPAAQALMSTLIAYSLNSPSQWNNLLLVPLRSEQTWQIIGVQLDAYFRSFWGIFGWFTVVFPLWIYRALLVVTGVCAVGCLGWLLGRDGTSRKQRLALLTVLGTLIGASLVAGVAERLPYYSFGELPQGRYLFPVLGAIGALYAVGFRAWLPRSRFGTATPTLVFVGALVALDVYAYLGVIYPIFSTTFR